MGPTLRPPRAHLALRRKRDLVEMKTYKSKWEEYTAATGKLPSIIRIPIYDDTHGVYLRGPYASEHVNHGAIPKVFGKDKYIKVSFEWLLPLEHGLLAISRAAFVPTVAHRDDYHDSFYVFAGHLPFGLKATLGNRYMPINFSERELTWLNQH